MKIAILTLNGHFNYGNRLQNYALQKFLSRYAEVVDTIWYNKNNYLPETDTWNTKILLKYFLNWKETRLELKKYYGKNCIKEYNIKKFSDKYISIKYDFKIKNNLNDLYDFFVVGSDQVWNPNYKYYFNEKFLEFASPSKRIAYSASFGVTSIKKNKEDIFKQGLAQMHAISVREEAGKKIVSKLINKDVPVLVDPTLLLSKKDWMSIEKKPNWYKNEKYIFTYFLGDKPPIIDEISKKYNWKLINLMDRNNINIYTSQVEEFIYLIHNACLVCTDSFHGTVFSIIMNTPFLVVNRQQKGVENMYSRIDTLLKLFNFEDRYIDKQKNNVNLDDSLNMDFTNVEKIQERERQRSISYIKEALNLDS